MNVERVVSIILDSDSNSNWNKSDEEREEGFDSESFRMDRLSMEQGMMADKRGSVVTQFSYKMKMVKKSMVKTMAKTMGKTTMEIDLMIATLDLQV